MQEQTLKKVAIVGRPNVGKSSLFNRLARQRDAITSDMSGTTRDVKKRVVTISQNREFEVIDTGGIDYSSELFSKVAEFSLRAAEQADIIIYMVDGKTLPSDEDRELFYKLQEQGKPLALVVNKIDNDKMSYDEAEKSHLDEVWKQVAKAVPVLDYKSIKFVIKMESPKVLSIKKSERGTHTALVRVKRDGKVFTRKQRVGRKESEIKKDKE